MVAWLKPENDPPDAPSVMARAIILKYLSGCWKVGFGM
jgi:hypothetical protein